MVADAAVVVNVTDTDDGPDGPGAALAEAWFNAKTLAATMAISTATWEPTAHPHDGLPPKDQGRAETARCLNITHHCVDQVFDHVLWVGLIAGW